MTEQLTFPYKIDQQDFMTFLTQWLAIEDEEDRLREAKRLLKDEYKASFPMRAVLTAVKVVRARRTREQLSFDS